MRIKGTLCLLAAIGLTSCSSINYLAIETYNPAEITFPERVEKILIVNNAVPQPDQSVCTYTLFDVAQDTCKVRVDSALVHACRGLGNAILEGDYFRDVLLYNTPLRNDDDFLVEQKLSAERVKELCQETDADAIIALEKLLFILKKDVRRVPDSFVQGDVRVDVGGVFRTYLPSRNSALATVQMNDSLFWSEFSPDVNTLDLILPSSEEMVQFTGNYFGSKIYPNFVPYWQNENRWYYTAIGSSWKLAAAYAGSGKWDEAGNIWKQMYAKSGKSETKAKCASNIALASEMTGQLEEALDWANKALALWNESRAEDDQDRKLSYLYTEALTERIRLNKKLDQQIGTE